MYAEIPDNIIGQKAHLFDIGKVYTIKKIIVQNAKRSYRVVDKDLMISITQYTTAKMIVDPPNSIPEYVYRLTQFAAIKVARVVFNLTGIVSMHTLFRKYCSMLLNVPCSHRVK
jgi:hypothetical protein